MNVAASLHKSKKAKQYLSMEIALQNKLGPKGWNAKKSLAAFAKKAKRKFSPHELGIKVVNLKKLNIVFFVPFWAAGL